MNILQIGIIVFIFIEFLNIMLLYFQPSSRMGNAVGVFNAYEESKNYPKIHIFIGYLINWVAGAKLIFIMVGIVVVLFGNYNTQLFTVIALIVSILSFYWRLFPTIKKLDIDGEITPKGYYKTLNYMILSFIIGFIIVLVISII